MTLAEILSLPPEQAAPLLLGATLTTTNEAGEITGGILTEVEAYLPEEDSASHSFIGPTKRNRSMFMEAGTFYVYTLRHHSLANVVTENNDRPGAILFRALEPTIGVEIMQQRRPKDISHLANGPAKLTQALDITLKDDGIDLLSKNSRVKIIPAKKPLSPKEIVLAKRIGISKNRDAPLRFYIKGSKYISYK